MNAAPTPGCRPAIGPGFRLQWEEAQGCQVLLFPEGLVQLNGSAGEIMKRCDGQRTLAEIVTELESAFSARDLMADVSGFVTLAAGKGWLRWSS